MRNDKMKRIFVLVSVVFLFLGCSSAQEQNVATSDTPPSAKQEAPAKLDFGPVPDDAVMIHVEQNHYPEGKPLEILWYVRLRNGYGLYKLDTIQYPKPKGGKFLKATARPSVALFSQMDGSRIYNQALLYKVDVSPKSKMKISPLKIKVTAFNSDCGPDDVCKKKTLTDLSVESAEINL